MKSQNFIMKRNDLLYNNLLDKLKKIEPVLSNSEKLTDDIIQRIEKTIPYSQKSRVLRISGIISGVAASALICLFLYDTMKFSTSYRTGYVIQSASENKINPIRKNQNITIDEYFKNKKNKAEQKEQLYSSFMAKNILK